MYHRTYKVVPLRGEPRENDTRGGKHFKPNAQRDYDMYQLYLKGVTAKELARKFKIGLPRVGEILTDEGIKDFHRRRTGGRLCRECGAVVYIQALGKILISAYCKRGHKAIAVYDSELKCFIV